MSLVHHLDAAAAHVLEAVKRHPIEPSDTAVLIAAFHRAESLAEGAIRAALPLVDPLHQAELAEQLEDERRHVAVFAGWLPSGGRDCGPASSAQRPAGTWYALLLLNELAGFCQFEMLAAQFLSAAEASSPPDGDASARGLPVARERPEIGMARQRALAVRGIAEDERRHIARLVRWVAALPPSFDGELDRVTARFRQGLEARMRQFLPREELADLRRAVAAAIDQVIVDVVPRRAAMAAAKHPKRPPGGAITTG